MAQLVDLARYVSLGEAQIAKSYLGAHGITAFVPDEHLAGNFDLSGIMTSGVRLQVLESDLPRALELLEQAENPSDF